MKQKKHRAFNILGNIAIVNFPKDWKKTQKINFAKKLLKDNNVLKTVLEKSSKVKGRLRKLETRWLVGEKTKEVLYKENGCVFRFNIDTTYFSPRLSNERKEIAKKIRKAESVLVMFAGVAPYPIVIAKNSKVGKVVSNEINRKANKYAKLNTELNKVKNKIEFWDGNIKRIKKREKFDVIVMPRPQLKDSFLKEAFRFSKTGTRIFYYDFCEVGKEKEVVEKIKNEAKKARKKIRVLKIKRAGEIAPYKIRLRVDFKII
ncbi:MAG: hypothetical protein KKF48_00665 [Nanoarchaeota archaeon]|nr:hypothetical protein [Nanoarchaeota archaeon]MBU1027535.1 hypothetical protein [Nanoarchaeota archaeon]